MSIFPVFLLLGVVYGRQIGSYGNGTYLRPIVTRSEERRICAELCMAGLGGEPCGADCVDLTPQDYPVQSETVVEASEGSRHQPRESACPVLCRNRLGYPLCNCDDDVKLNKHVDLLEVCTFYCLSFDYQLSGCQDCDLVKSAIRSHDKSGLSATYLKSTINWNLWCQAMCYTGNGGAACECDLLPMAVAV